MASHPLYSDRPHEDLGNPAFVPVLLVAALVGGFLVPKRWWLIGLMLGLPAFALSPWTAPRGDGDGLWGLIVPFLFFFIFALIGAAMIGGGIRTRMRTRERQPSHT